jgi:drug/metabolite transporter (DMT)-like permease
MAAPPSTSTAKIVVAFLVVTAIWGSTWLVIRDQVSAVPASWSIAYRFAIACIGMFVFAALRGDSLRLSREGMKLAVLVGLSQFFLNFQFVYRAEMHLTSGLVAVFYALLMVPNAVLGRIFLGETTGTRFLLGSLVAIGGIALLLVHEFRDAPPEGRIALGILFTCAGLLSASSANILQATPVGRRQSVVPLLAWAMAWGALADAAFGLVVAGPPVLDWRWEYFAGIFYLAVFGSVVTFPLYFVLIRTLGAGRAAYNGVAVPVVAMALSTLFEGYRWTGLAAGGALLALAGLLVALSARAKRA